MKFIGLIVCLISQQAVTSIVFFYFFLSEEYIVCTRPDHITFTILQYNQDEYI